MAQEGRTEKGSRDGGPARITELRDMKERGEPIAVLTCYDHLFARILEAAGVDLVLVGDSVGQVLLGYDSTLPVTLEEMIHHGAAVRRGLEDTLLVVDLPFGSYQAGVEDAVRSGIRVLKETGAEGVKLEGADDRTLASVRALTDSGVPVMGHLGLTPQSVHQMGGYGVRGREPSEAGAIRRRARALEEAGCFSLVLEMVPSDLAGEVTRSLGIPTIGIGAGPRVDGQVLVLHDMLGLNRGFRPRFLRRFAELGDASQAAAGEYVRAVKEGDYPSEEEEYAG